MLGSNHGVQALFLSTISEIRSKSNCQKYLDYLLICWIDDCFVGLTIALLN